MAAIALNISDALRGRPRGRRSCPRIEGALSFRPSPHIDDRGFFCRTFAIP